MVQWTLPVLHKPAEKSETFKETIIKKIRKTDDDLRNYLATRFLSPGALILRVIFNCFVINFLSRAYEVSLYQLDYIQLSFFRKWASCMLGWTFQALVASTIAFQLIPTIFKNQKYVHMCVPTMICMAIGGFFMVVSVVGSVVSLLVDLQYVLFTVYCTMDLMLCHGTLLETLKTCTCETHQNAKELDIICGSTRKQIRGRQYINEEELRKTFEKLSKGPLFLFNKEGEKIFTFYGNRYKYMTTGEYILKTASQFSEEEPKEKY